MQFLNKSWLRALILIFCFEYLPWINGDNNCLIDKLEIPIKPNRVILRFECDSGNDHNPTIPIDNGSKQSEYNELDLSPNLYYLVPITQICPFINIYLLDLSDNKIISLENVFTNLSCLLSLKQLDLSNNSIQTPLTEQDFNDELPSHLEYLNLKDNQIPAVESGVFFKKDGTARFPKLAYLDLSNNRIIKIDLLWPMTFPNLSVKVFLNNNMISTLTNEMDLSYDNSVLIGITSNRNVDLRNNSLTSLDDSNLLQYKLNSEEDFKNFLYKLSNYDFRNNELECICPNQTGLYTVHWFKIFSSTIPNPPTLIYQLKCLNYENTYIFDFPCVFHETTSTTTTTTNSPKTTTTTLLTNTVSFAKLVSNNQNQSIWWLLLLLLIPLIMIIILVFMCCFGRSCLLCCHRSFSINFCSCFRPENREKDAEKIYDSTICYHETDQNWVEDIFMPPFAKFGKGFKIKKFLIETPTPKSVLLNKERLEILRMSKRIILLFTTKFADEIWSNKNFKGEIKNICLNNRHCVIVLINVEFIEPEKIKEYINFIQTGNEFDQEGSFKISKFEIAKKKIINNIKHNCGLKNVESLDWQDDGFWKKLTFAMPIIKNPEKPTEVIGTSKYVRLNRENFVQTPSSVGIIDSDIDRNHLSLNSLDLIKTENELQLITKLKNSIEENRLPPINLAKSNPTEQVNPNFESIEKDNFWNMLAISRKEEREDAKRIQINSVDLPEYFTKKYDKDKRITIPDEVANKLDNKVRGDSDKKHNFHEIDEFEFKNELNNHSKRNFKLIANANNPPSVSSRSDSHTEIDKGLAPIGENVNLGTNYASMPFINNNLESKKNKTKKEKKQKKAKKTIVMEAENADVKSHEIVPAINQAFVQDLNEIDQTEQKNKKRKNKLKHRHSNKSQDKDLIDTDEIQHNYENKQIEPLKTKEN